MFTKAFRKAIAISLVFTVLLSLVAVRGTVEGHNEAKPEASLVYNYSRTMYTEKDGTRVVNLYSKGKLIASATFNEKSRRLNLYDFEVGIASSQKVKLSHTKAIKVNGGVNAVENHSKGKPKYKFITRYTSYFKVGKLTISLAFVALSAIAPGAGIAALISIAGMIVEYGARYVRYTVDVYSYRKRREHHFKRIFRFYKKGTSRKLGTCTTYNVTYRR